MPKKIEVDQDSRSLENIAERLESCAAAVRASAALMQSKGIETLSIPNYTSLKLGIQRVESFANAAKTAVYNAFENRGDFMAKPEPSPEPKRKRA